MAQGYQDIKPFLEGDTLDTAGALRVLNDRKSRLQSEGKSTDDTQEAIDAIESRDASRINYIKKTGQAFMDKAVSAGLLEATGAGGKMSADQRGFEETIKDFTPQEQEDARRVRAGIKARAGESADERVARDKELAAQIVQFEADKAEGKEFGKGKGFAKAAPLIATAKANIAKAVTLAQKEADSRGEALSDLRKAEAGMPGIEQVVGKLRELSPLATHTLTGRAWNFAAKEAGFGSTKGATARAAYQATIDNQVLPLLKATFGAAMTEGEGKRLAATLGDVNAPPEEKQAQLDAFLASQKRQIENLNREVSATDPAPVQGGTSTAGEFSNVPDDDLFN